MKSLILVFQNSTFWTKVHRQSFLLSLEYLWAYSSFIILQYHFSICQLLRFGFHAFDTLWRLVFRIHVNHFSKLFFSSQEHDFESLFTHSNFLSHQLISQSTTLIPSNLYHFISHSLTLTISISLPHKMPIHFLVWSL